MPSQPRLGFGWGGGDFCTPHIIQALHTQIHINTDTWLALRALGGRSEAQCQAKDRAKTGIMREKPCLGQVTLGKLVKARKGGYNII